MSEKKIRQPGAANTQRRKEWVEFEDGTGWWVWELTVAETTRIIDQSQVQSKDPRVQAMTRGRQVVLQIMHSCYDGDEPGSKRIFGDNDFGAAYEIPFRDFGRLIAAIEEVNGTGATQQEILRDFTAATGEPNPSG